MFESKAGVLVVGGVGFFLFAFLSNAVVPILMYENMPEQKLADLPNANLMYQFEDMQRRWPGPMKAAFDMPESLDDARRLVRAGSPQGLTEAQVDEQAQQLLRDWPRKTAAEMLALGRKVYVGEGCWHCHSQYVRPVSNETKRWGPVARSYEYQNELQRPVMFGTRRVGPDLSREGGRRSNDWHAVHFLQPSLVSPNSPMPNYPWLFDGDASRPNRRGLALILYVQWLGSWLESYPDYEEFYAQRNEGGAR